MIASERERYIMQRINEHGIVNLKEIALQIGTSETTIRRDFEKLEKKGKLKRVQGGATSSDENQAKNENAQITTRLKTKINMDKKIIVANFASDLVHDGESVYIDDGTSLLALAEKLMYKRINIVTNSTLVLKKARHSNAEVFIIGGKFIPSYEIMVGSIAQEILEKFHFDHAFIGTFGVSLEQNVAYTTEDECLSLKKIAIKNSHKKHLLLDDSKINKHGFYTIDTLEKFDTIICNDFQSRPDKLPQNLILV